jgi:hypothetical protein
MFGPSQDPSGQHLYRLTQVYPTPDYVRNARAEDLHRPNLPAHLYADPDQKCFPCHTPAATWASMAYWLDQEGHTNTKKAADLNIYQRIHRYGRFHNISADLTKLELAAKGPRANPDDYALWIEGQPRYPLRTKEEVKQAADYLLRWRRRFSYPQRRQFASRILEKQAALHVSFSEETQEQLERLAGLGAGTAKQAAQAVLDRALRVRQRYGPDPGPYQELLRLGEVLLRHPSQLREPGARCKLAAALDQFDRYYQLEDIEGPEEAIFPLTRQKMADCLREHVALPNGLMYRLADLERLPLRTLREVFGDDWARELSSDGLTLDAEKAAQILPTLPLPDAHEFSRLCQENGLLPVGKDKTASYALGIPLELLQALRRGSMESAWGT